MDSVRPKRLKKRQTGRVGAVEAEFFNGLLELRLGYALGAKVKYNGIAVDITPYASGETARIRFGG